MKKKKDKGVKCIFKKVMSCFQAVLWRFHCLIYISKVQGSVKETRLNLLDFKINLGTEMWSRVEFKLCKNRNLGKPPVKQCRLIGNCGNIMISDKTVIMGPEVKSTNLELRAASCEHWLLALRFAFFICFSHFFHLVSHSGRDFHPNTYLWINRSTWCDETAAQGPHGFAFSKTASPPRHWLAQVSCDCSTVGEDRFAVLQHTAQHTLFNTSW